VSRYKAAKWIVICLGGRKFVNGYRCSVAVQICNGAKNFIMVQNCNYEQVRESGLITSYRVVLAAGTKAKTVTNKLPLLSVLAKVLYVQ
jgi:hypothetical protein